MTKRDYYIKVSEIIRAAVIGMKLTDEEIATLKEKAERTAFEFRDPVVAELNAAKEDKEAIRAECIRTVRVLSDEYIKSAKSDEAMKPEEITDDIKLLNVGINIPVDDLGHMIRRNAGNSTMSRLIAAYVADSGSQISDELKAMLNAASHKNTTAIRIANDIPDIAYHMLQDRMYTKEGVFDKIIGNQSEAYAEFIESTGNNGGANNGN
jgi:RecA/RadA recombinase